MTTSQQRADEWLKVWQQLRRMGYTPEQRDRIIELLFVTLSPEKYT